MINKIHCMDCVQGLKMLKNESVDVIVTSPPLIEYLLNKMGVGENNEDLVKEMVGDKDDRT